MLCDVSRGLCDGPILRPEESYRVCLSVIRCNNTPVNLNWSGTRGQTKKEIKMDMYDTYGIKSVGLAQGPPTCKPYRDYVVYTSGRDAWRRHGICSNHVNIVAEIILAVNLSRPWIFHFLSVWRFTRQNLNFQLVPVSIHTEFRFLKNQSVNVK